MKNQKNILWSLALLLAVCFTAPAFAQLPPFTQADSAEVAEWFADTTEVRPDPTTNPTWWDFKVFQIRVLNGLEKLQGVNYASRLQIVAAQFIAAGYFPDLAMDMAKKTLNSSNYDSLFSQMRGIVHVDKAVWETAVKNDSLFQALVRKTDTGYTVATTLRDQTVPVLRQDVTNLSGGIVKMDSALTKLAGLYLDRHGPKNYNMPKQEKKQAEGSLAAFYKARAARAAALAGK